MEFISRFPIVIVLAALAILLLIIIRIPLKLIFKLLINTALGFAALLFINYFGSFLGISITVNWINALIIGVLGVPGVGVVLILSYLALI